MLHLDATATAAPLGWPDLIDALRRAFTQGRVVPLRHTHRIDDPAGRGGTLLLMPAWQPGRWLGLKTVGIFPGNNELGLPGLHSTYTLFDARTGVPVALLDGDVITSRRTAAAAALAASFLAREASTTLLVLGSGRVARLLPGAMRCVRPIERVLAWNHRPEGALALARQCRDEGFAAQAVTNLEAAVAQADIVSCATLAGAALVRGAWLREGTHLDLIGSFTPQMRESDGACFSRSRVFVDTEEALAKSGDVLGAIAEGAFEPARLQGTLAQLCRGETAGRGGPREITLFKAVGNALEDLAAAERVADVMLGS